MWNEMFMGVNPVEIVEHMSRTKKLAGYDLNKIS